MIGVLVSRRGNALFGWVSVALSLASAAVFTAFGEFLVGFLALLVALLAASPAVALRDPLAMAPWGVVALAVLPFLLYPFPRFAATAAHVGVAGVALLMAIYLTAFTGVEMTARFAVAMVVLTTVAVGTVWAATRGIADLYFGSSYLGGLAALEGDLLAAVGGGVVAGLLFEGYFRERSHGHLHGVPVQEA